MKSKYLIIVPLSLVCFVNQSCILNSQKENESKLKLDLEIDAPNILRILGNNTYDEQFNEAQQIAIDDRHKVSDKDFVSLFVEKYDSIDNTAMLAPIFLNESYDKIKLTDSNSQVKERLYRKV